MSAASNTLDTQIKALEQTIQHERVRLNAQYKNGKATLDECKAHIALLYDLLLNLQQLQASGMILILSDAQFDMLCHYANQDWKTAALQVIGENFNLRENLLSAQRTNEKLSTLLEQFSIRIAKHENNPDNTNTTTNGDTNG